MAEPHPVWIRRNIQTDTCPKSLVTAQSINFLEEFAAWRGGLMTDVNSLSSRQIEAFQLLENEVAEEARYAKQNAANDIQYTNTGLFRN